MYSKHFDSKEFLLQIMNSFEAEAEQLLKIYINKHKSEKIKRVYFSTLLPGPDMLYVVPVPVVFIASIKYAGCNLAM